MAHREAVRAYLEDLTLDGAVVHDWGSGAKPVERYVTHKGCKFIRIDKNNHPEFPPHYKVDIQIPLEIDYLADHAFLIEVLEHTTDPLAVLKNVYHNLREGGKFHLSVPFLYPEHGDQDYLRFTKQGLLYYLNMAGFVATEIWEIPDGFMARASK